jgi:starch phosphorylase
VNGGLNLSELDGWWAEAYTPEVGWAIGDGKDRGDDPLWDAAEADAMYALLEGDVTSAFYTRDTQGIPRGWVKRMRESMTRLTPAFSASRAVHDYTDRHYVPAAAAYRERSANHGAEGARVLYWRAGLERHWQSAHFGDLEVQTDGHQHAFRVNIDVGNLDPAQVGVELYADGEDGQGPLRLVMTPSVGQAGSRKTSVWEAVVTSSRPATDFTPRLVALHAIAHGPLEAPFILWAEGKWRPAPAVSE